MDWLRSVKEREVGYSIAERWLRWEYCSVRSMAALVRRRSRGRSINPEIIYAFNLQAATDLREDREAAFPIC